MNTGGGLRRNVATAELSRADMLGFLGTLYFRLRSSSVFFTLFDIKVTYDRSEIYSTNKKKKKKEMKLAVFHQMFFLKKKFANAITFIVVYILIQGGLKL